MPPETKQTAREVRRGRKTESSSTTSVPSITSVLPPMISFTRRGRPGPKCICEVAAACALAGCSLQSNPPVAANRFCPTPVKSELPSCDFRDHIPQSLSLRIPSRYDRPQQILLRHDQPAGVANLSNRFGQPRLMRDT